jgi:MoxR-like ATPase
MAFAAYMNMAFYAVGSTSGTEGSQLNGRIIPDEERDGGFVWQDGPLTDIIRYGGVLLINEIDFLSERFTTHLFQVLDERREIALLDHKGEVIHAPDNFLVIADHNGTDARYRGTRQLNAALADRFAVKLNLDYNPDVEAKIVSSPTLRSIVADLRVQAKEGIIETPISTRMMMEFEEIALDLGTEFAIDNFLNAFDDDVRAPIEHTMNLRSNELMRDIARLVVRTEATVTKPTQDEWLGDEEFATYSDDQFYTPAELDGIGYEELVRRAKLTDFDEDEIDAMDSATLVNFLCGKHEYWDADVTVGA